MGAQKVASADAAEGIHVPTVAALNANDIATRAKRACGVCQLSYAAENVFDAVCCGTACCLFCVKAGLERRVGPRRKLSLRMLDDIDEDESVVRVDEMFALPAASEGGYPGLAACVVCRAPAMHLRCPPRHPLTVPRRSSSSASSGATPPCCALPPAAAEAAAAAKAKPRAAWRAVRGNPVASDLSPARDRATYCALSLLFQRLLC